MSTAKNILFIILERHLIWAILAVLFLAGIAVPGFLSVRNILNVMWAAAPLGCMVLGLFFVTQFFTPSSTHVAWEAHAVGMAFGALVALVLARFFPDPSAAPPAPGWSSSSARSRSRSSPCW